MRRKRRRSPPSTTSSFTYSSYTSGWVRMKLWKNCYPIMRRRGAGKKRLDMRTICYIYMTRAHIQIEERKTPTTLPDIASSFLSLFDARNPAECERRVRSDKEKPFCTVTAPSSKKERGKEERVMMMMVGNTRPSWHRSGGVEAFTISS